MRLAVVGTGLMGASVALAAKRAGTVRVAGFDTDRDVVERAVARGAVDDPAATLEEALASADLAVVAEPGGGGTGGQPGGVHGHRRGLDQGRRVPGCGWLAPLRRGSPRLRLGDTGARPRQR
ncbi:MAG: hypothetical protein C4307_00550 [Chloroflexota bacterium]